MDPFSVAIGCVSLLDAVTRLSHSVTNFVVGFRDAQKDLAAVTRELSDLDLSLQILKADTDPKQSYELPNDLRRYVCGIMQNCRIDVTDFEASLHEYGKEGLNQRAKWAISGRIEAQKIRTALAAHKGALNLAAETISL
ncbi:hypothetical protein CNMCM5878_009929 [Aspergillus fumigatiaffinis]|jgi:hypothetical protein|nr:hypothetical protein CNMCM5878_009929 [Aspergillus fumigatiaffinis]